MEKPEGASEEIKLSESVGCSQVSLRERECLWDDQPDNCEGRGRFFKAADGSDVQMSEGQSRGTGVQLNITSQKK